MGIVENKYDSQTLLRYGLVLLFAMALLFDTLSTIRFMITEGIDLEVHPLVRHCAWYYGPVLGTLMSSFLFKILAGLIVIRILDKYAPYFLALSIIIFSLAGIWNIWGYTLYM